MTQYEPGHRPDDLQAIDQPHKAPEDEEKIYYEGSPQMRGELKRLSGYGLLGALVAAGGIACFFAHMSAMTWIGIILILAGLVLWTMPFLLAKSTRYRISNYRIDYERGILSKKIDTLELWHVEDLGFRQSLFDRILDVGTITIVSHDETTPNLSMHGIPNPRPVFDALKQRVIAVKRQRGVIKMDVG
jgi:Bacterial PH domain